MEHKNGLCLSSFLSPKNCSCCFKICLLYVEQYIQILQILHKKVNFYFFIRALLRFYFSLYFEIIQIIMGNE